jgi:hypothetical protein
MNVKICGALRSTKFKNAPFEDGSLTGHYFYSVGVDAKRVRPKYRNIASGAWW